MLNTNEKIIKHKVGLLNLAEELGNVSKACKIMGLSRDTFYRYQEAVEEGGIEALFEQTRRKPNPKNRVDEPTEAAVVAHALEQPAHGQARTSNELRKQGVFVSGMRDHTKRDNLSRQFYVRFGSKADLELRVPRTSASCPEVVGQVFL